MKIGLSSWAYRYAAGTRDFSPPHPLTHLGLLERASALGAEVVQICDNMPLDHFDDASLTRLRAEAERRGIVLEVGTTDTRREHLARFVEIASLTGARILRVAENMTSWQPTVDDITAEISAVLPACRRHGVTIAVENHFSLGTRDLAQLMQKVNDEHAGICLDTVNSIARLEGWREAVTMLAPFTVSLHLKDAGAARTGVGFYIGGRVLGQGMVDFPAVLSEVKAQGRQPNALLELWMDPAQDGETTLRQEEQWIADSLAYMRRII
jgi:sugar phosphate isomerase/epimerase